MSFIDIMAGLVIGIKLATSWYSAVFWSAVLAFFLSLFVLWTAYNFDTAMMIRYLKAAPLSELFPVIIEMVFAAIAGTVGFGVARLIQALGARWL